VTNFSGANGLRKGGQPGGAEGGMFSKAEGGAKYLRERRSKKSFVGSFNEKEREDGLTLYNKAK